MKHNAFIFVILFGVGVTLSFNVWGALTSVPGVLSAPVVLYDDGGNVLPDGDYGVVITLQEADGVILFQEHQDAVVINGVAALTIGSGEEVSGEHTSSGGLSDDIFLASDEVHVEITVDGQEFSQEVARLGSQPYSFISNYALRVAPDAVTGTVIQDGSITANDLEPSFLSELRKSASLENSSMDGVAGDVVGTEDAQNTADKNLDATYVISGFAIKSGIVGADYIDDAIARDAELSFSNLNGSAADSQIPSTIARDSELVFSNLSGFIADSQIPSSVTRDSELAFSNLSGLVADSQIPSGITRDSELVFSNFGGSVADSQIPLTIARDSEVDADVNALDSRIKNLENDTITVSEVPAAIRPFAYGTMTRPSGGSCSGYNMDSDCTFTSNSADANYQVVITPLSALTCGTYTGTCYVSSKSAASFALTCTCPSGGTLSPQIDFVVYRK